MKPSPGPAYLLLCAAVSALWLGCATAPRYPAGEAMLRGETPTLPRTPDSLRAELELTAFGGGRKSTLSAAFSAKPRRDYKLDLYGLPGMVAGSFLWTRDGWTLVLFDREGYSQGIGEHVEIGDLGLREVSVHDLFAFLWGDFLPGRRPSDNLIAGLPGDWRPLGAPGAPEAHNAGTFAYTGGGQRWRVSLDAKTGVVREAMREDSAFRVVYGDYRTLKGAPGRPIPGKARLFRYRDPVLEIKVKSVEDDPHWRRNPFAIKVPKGFAPLSGVGDGESGTR